MRVYTLLRIVVADQKDCRLEYPMALTTEVNLAGQKVRWTGS